MLFNSWEFVVLVLASFFLYYLPWARRLQAALLIAASFVFYGYGQPRLLLLLVASVAINSQVSRLVYSSSLRRARIWTSVGVAANLLILSLFKYGPLLSRTFFGAARPGSLGHVLLLMPLPVGISFYTFQGMSLVVDSFKSHTTEEFRGLIHARSGTHWLHTMLFVSFFPQLVAGPIVKAHDFIPQIGAKEFRDINWDLCFRTLVLGYFLKLVVADNLKDYIYWLAYPYFMEFNTLHLLAILFGYSMQIFADFAGYSLIAIGVGALFGYRLPENFNFPYISVSFSEFWKRWHISLSSWLREYLYFPLGGNRRGTMRTYANLMIVMFLGGLWHGAAWSYAIWGAVHGGLLAVERLFQRRVAPTASTVWSTVATSLRMMFVFSMVTLAWLLFKLPRIEHVLSFVQAAGSNAQRSVRIPDVWYLFYFSSPVVIYHFHYLLKSYPRFRAVSLHMQPISYGLMLAAIVLESGTSSEFIYFQF